MSGPVRGGGRRGDTLRRPGAGRRTAAQLGRRGDVRFEPCHHHSAVGPMAGMTTWSMPVLIVEDRATGTRAYSNLNEGLGRVLRYGALGPDVLDRLDWIRRCARARAGRGAARMPDGIDLRG